MVLSSTVVWVSLVCFLCIWQQKTPESCCRCRRASQNFSSSSKSGKWVCICSGSGYSPPPRLLEHVVEFPEEETLYSSTSTSPLQLLWEWWIEGGGQQRAGGTTSSEVPSSNAIIRSEERTWRISKNYNEMYNMWLLSGGSSLSKQKTFVESFVVRAERVAPTLFTKEVMFKSFIHLEFSLVRRLSLLKVTT